MKNSFKLLFTLSFLVLISACKKDSESGVEGDWTAKSFTLDVQSTTTVQGQTISQDIQGVGSDINYDLSFDGSNFTTKGGYTMTTTVNTGGFGSTTSIQDYSNIDGSGTYTIDGNKMTLEGSFFSLAVDGVEYAQTSDPQTSDFEINGDGDLVFSQNETMMTNDPITGIMTETTIVSASVWERK